MSKITQARARSDRRELKDLKAKLYRYVNHTYPGVWLRDIGIIPDTKLVLETAVKLHNDIVYRFDEANSRVRVYAVKRS